VCVARLYIRRVFECLCESALHLCCKRERNWIKVCVFEHVSGHVSVFTCVCVCDDPPLRREDSDPAQQQGPVAVVLTTFHPWPQSVLSAGRGILMCFICPGMVDMHCLWGPQFTDVIIQLVVFCCSLCYPYFGSRAGLFFRQVCSLDRSVL